MRRKHRRTTGERTDIEDTSPPEIQRLRKIYIDGFMNTGHFNGPLHQQLLAYAVSQREGELQ